MISRLYSQLRSLLLTLLGLYVPTLILLLFAVLVSYKTRYSIAARPSLVL